MNNTLGNKNQHHYWEADEHLVSECDILTRHSMPHTVFQLRMHNFNLVMKNPQKSPNKEYLTLNWKEEVVLFKNFNVITGKTGWGTVPE